MDLIGTCYDLLHRPYPLHQRHVDMFRHKVIMGSYKGSTSAEPGPEFTKDTKRSPIKNLTSSNMQQSVIDEGVELNEESIEFA